MKQHGFFFDQSRCTGCQTCSVACKSNNGLPPGPLKYLRIYQYEKGTFPDLRIHIHWIPCYHCEKPACIDSCPTDAIYKEEKYGAVLIDKEKCDACRMCYEACPYGSPVFDSDSMETVTQKCTMCFDRLEQGGKPVCVLSCPMRALDFGPMDELTKTYIENRDLDDLPDSRKTKPAVVFKAHEEKRRLVPYDTDKALRLLMKRDPLPKIFSSISDITDIPEGMVGRSKLEIKHSSAEDLVRCTKNDEG